MKYYKDINGNLYADPASTEGLEEVLSPIRDDGTILPLHDNLNKVALKEDGTRYQAYLTEPDSDGIYQPDFAKMQESVAVYNKAKADVHRYELKYSPIEVFGVMWDVDEAARANMQEAVNTVKILTEMGTPEEQIPKTIIWTLADNSIRETTYEELNQVMLAANLRWGQIFEQYSIWKAGDMLTPFEM